MIDKIPSVAKRKDMANKDFYLLKKCRNAQ